MEFFEFKKELQKNVLEILKDVNHLFVVDVDKDELWNTYLDSFPEGTNPIYREKREYDCSACRQFIKSFGNVVVINNNEVKTIWDFKIEDSTFKPVIKALDMFIKEHSISDVFVTKYAVFGIDKSHELQENGKAITWEHLYIRLPEKFVTKSRETEPSIQGQFRDVRNVFKRSLDELTEDSVETVLELIAQKSLYKGEEWEAVLKQFLKLKKEYKKLNDADKEIFCWKQSIKVGPVVGKIRNHSIGTLLIDISNDIDINEAVRKYEAMVAPSNYKRPKAIFTKKMLEDAEKQIQELGFMESLGRRFATLDDITVNNILFSNRDAAKRIAGSVFDEMKQEVAVNPKQFDRVEEITIEKFIKDVLPTASKVEVLLENKHTANLVSLIAPKVKDSKTMFKWNNNFSWAYAGNITDSMKERVKSFGGKVDGVLRFSIQWNEDGQNQNDFDAHCIEPNENEIFYAQKINQNTTGRLDVDIRNPKAEINNAVAVENITWTNQGKMQEGKYLFFVHNFRHRGGTSGFSAEIEFDGQIYSFNYNKELRQDEKIKVAEVTYSKKNGFTIKELLPSSTSSRKVWNLDTNQFHPVSVCMYSPNYWDEQNGIGHRHYFFMLNKCVNDETPNGFFNEYLQEDLMKQKRVFEALGSKMRVEEVEDQLSGLGFSSTKPNVLICKVEGHTNRMLKINF